MRPRCGCLDYFDSLSKSIDLIAPTDAPEAEIAKARLTMRAQPAEQLAKLASLNQQIDQKLAEAQSVAPAVAKIDASMRLVEETAAVQRMAMESSMNRIAYLDARTWLIDQQGERVVQQRKLLSGQEKA